jgi:hypothetical protein
MTDLDRFIDLNNKEIVDFADQNVLPRINEFSTKYEIFSRLINQVQANMKFGEGVDRTHIMVASAILHSMWCGWIAQEMTDKGLSNFDKQNLQKFLDAINLAYEAGRRYAKETP